MTKYSYEIMELPLGNVIVRSDGAYVPFEDNNSDYQAYLRWLENPDAEENGTIS